MLGRLAYGVLQNGADGHLVLVHDVGADAVRPRIHRVAVILLGARRCYVRGVRKPSRLTVAVQGHSFGPQLVTIAGDRINIDAAAT